MTPQLVVVDGRYTYRWNGPDRLEVGDQVLLPAAWLPVRTGVVTGMASHYDHDDLVSILGRA